MLQNEPLEEDIEKSKPLKKVCNSRKFNLETAPLKLIVKRESSLLNDTIKITHVENKFDDLDKIFSNNQQKMNKKSDVGMKNGIFFKNNDDLIHQQSALEYHIANIESLLHRARRSTKFSSVGQSPLSVSYAANYEEKEHKGWVKPIFSSIVYRLPVSSYYFPYTNISVFDFIFDTDYCSYNFKSNKF